MWWILLVVLLLGRKSGSVSASVNVNPVATPSGTTSVGAPAGQPEQVLTLRPPITSPPFNNTGGVFFPDNGTFNPPKPPTLTPYTFTGPIPPVLERNMYIPGTDDPSINTAVGPPPPSVGTPLPPGNTIANLIVDVPMPPMTFTQMVPPTPEPMVPLAPLRTAANDGIVMVPRISQL
jgi:hypothetical protein